LKLRHHHRGLKISTVKKSQTISIAILATLTAAALFFAAWVSAVGVPSAGATAKGTTACFNTAKGTVFLRTTCKPGERKVVLGVPRIAGSVGPSAFDLAKVGGFSGTVAEWLGSLVGIAGLVGITGSTGSTGFAGTTGIAGPIGLTGEDGAAGAEGAVGTAGEAGSAGQKGDAGPSGAAGFIPAYGSFYDTTTQSNSKPGEVNTFTFDRSPIKEFGVTVESGKIYFAKAGTYNIQFSAQLFTSTKASVEQIDIWLATNGKNEPYSNTQVQVRSLGDKTGKAVAAWNFIVTIQEHNYCELRWVSDEATMAIAAVEGGSTPAGVAIPSIILSVVQVG